jgi:hypothetical protein
MRRHRHTQRREHLETVHNGIKPRVSPSTPLQTAPIEDSHGRRRNLSRCDETWRWRIEKPNRRNEMRQPYRQWRPIAQARTTAMSDMAPPSMFGLRPGSPTMSVTSAKQRGPIYR